MNIMKPPCIWIEGICYRKNIVNQIYQQSSNSEGIRNRNKNTQPVEEESYDNYDDCPEECPDIVKIDENNYELKLKIPKDFFGFIIGYKGNTKKRIENETRTKIIVPNHKSEIIVKGSRSRYVESAKTRIEVIVEDARQKFQPTHFISIPLNFPCIKTNFLEFQDSILRELEQCRGMDASLFQKPEKLHLTIGTLVLLNSEERDRAAQVLTECNEEIIRPLLQSDPLMVNVEGLEYMNDDPAEVDVLYAKVNSSLGNRDLLQLLADELVEKFVSTGLMQKQYERVKIHLTIMNSSFRNSGSSNNSGGAREKKQRLTFDAKPIFEKFSDYKFGRAEVTTIHLSSMHSLASDGYYTPSSVINI